jgi:hypothetical protein
MNVLRNTNSYFAEDIAHPEKDMPRSEVVAHPHTTICAAIRNSVGYGAPWVDDLKSLVVPDSEQFHKANQRRRNPSFFSSSMTT